MAKFFSGILLILASAVPLQAAGPGEDLFQKAVVKESVERDPEGAIHLYQQVLDQRGISPALTAETHLRLGICFEKVGKPRDANSFYQSVVSQTSGVSSSVLQQARNNLVRIQAEHPEIFGGTITIREWKHRYVPNRFSVGIGPSILVSNGGTPAVGLSAGLRYQISPSTQTTAWFGVVRAVMPLSGSEVAHQTEPHGSQITDTGTLKLRYQSFFGVSHELPHGRQRLAIPEWGAGVALTSAKISYRNATSSGDQKTNTWSPYAEVGLRVWPDRVVSALLRIGYVPAPYPKSIDIPAPQPHSQTFNFPSSVWDVGVAVQLKLGWFVRELRP